MRTSSLLTIGLSTSLILAACSTQTTTSTPPNTTSGAVLRQNTEGMMPKSKGNPQTAQEKIDNARSAAPAMIAKDATVADWPGADGKLVELQKGTNGWTCLPDFPVSPGNDPICVDGNAMAWFQAYMGHTEPKLTQAGIGYMLQGGSDASNTDPYAEKPAAGEDWMNAPPHIMLFPAGKLDTAVYGTTMDGSPWIMWAGTPYQHLMVPVQ